MVLEVARVFIRNSPVKLMDALNIHHYELLTAKLDFIAAENGDSGLRGRTEVRFSGWLWLIEP